MLIFLLKHFCECTDNIQIYKCVKISLHYVSFELKPTFFVCTSHFSWYQISFMSIENTVAAVGASLSRLTMYYVCQKLIPHILYTQENCIGIGAAQLMKQHRSRAHNEHFHIRRIMCLRATKSC